MALSKPLRQPRSCRRSGNHCHLRPAQKNRHCYNHRACHHRRSFHRIRRPSLVFGHHVARGLIFPGQWMSAPSIISQGTILCKQLYHISLRRTQCVLKAPRQGKPAARLQIIESCNAAPACTSF